ncbi:MAG: DUF4249 family protein [Siphonobacter sp.]
MEISGPAYQKKIVLTGLLHPDSLLSIRLRYSKPVTDTGQYEPVSGATVLFEKDGVPLGTATERSAGQYNLPILPTVGHLYSVRAVVKGFETIEASENLPDLPAFEVSVGARNQSNPNSNPDITFSSSILSGNLIWLGISNSFHSFYKTSPTCPNCLVHETNRLLTKDVIFDSFNGYFDTFNSFYSYDYPARFQPDYIQNNVQVSTVFVMQNQGASWENPAPDEQNILDVFSAGKAFDQYLKTAILSQKNQIVNTHGELDNPFAEVVPVYSNVKNGLGIFGARNSRRIPLRILSKVTSP